MNLIRKLKQIKDSIFWRRALCEQCGCYQSSSNRSACMYCHKGDLAYQNFKSDDEWFDLYSKRFKEFH